MKFYLNAATLIILYAIYGCFCAVITGLRICDRFEWMASSDLLYSTWNSAQCYVAGWMGGEYGEGCACVLSCFSRVLFCMTLWTVVSQAPLSMGFSRKEYWGGLPCPSPGDLPDPGIEPTSLMSPVLAGEFFTTSATGYALLTVTVLLWRSQRHPPGRVAQNRVCCGREGRDTWSFHVLSRLIASPASWCVPQPWSSLNLIV